jgi:BASS family bile acid:Na+ symporter
MTAPNRILGSLRGWLYTVWIVAAVAVGLLWPGAVLGWRAFDPRNKAVILAVVQLVMFGMGTQMSLRDFAGTVRAPRGVIVGTVCHFAIMPFLGFALARALGFPHEIAAGLVLIGACSSGLASNVMAYIARANLVLSVTVTALTTLVAPLATPLLMKLLAGAWVRVDFLPMVTEIVKIVLVPIGAALFHDYLKNGSDRGRRFALVCAAAGAVVLALSALAGSGASAAPLAWAALVAESLVAGALYHALWRVFPRVAGWMPFLSMAGIVYFTLITTAAGRDNLLRVGGLLVLACALQNAAGYFLGFWVSRGCGLDRNSARAVAFEVGLLNGGMATGLAAAMGKLTTVGLASAVFSPLMNISGSVLAIHWQRHPPDAPAPAGEPGGSQARA